jgi:RNA polymerase II subunit A-like phosphatase
LDQTIIHTTVEQTVGEWMDEIDDDGDEEQEREEEIGPPPLAKADPSVGSDHAGEGETTTPPRPPRPTKRKRKSKPDHYAEALKDVARFTLPDDPASGQGRGNQPERWYYTKPR